MIQAFSDWLVNTWLSHLFADNIWTIAVVQTIHILCVAIVMISVAVFNMRILGLAGRNQSVSALAQQYMPWIWRALIILVITGIFLIIAEPARELMNVTFRVKMLLLLSVVLITHYYVKKLRSDAHFWDVEGRHHSLGVTLSSISMIFWVGIVVCGRLIAYVGGIYV
jgi:hypothetical protein